MRAHFWHKEHRHALSIHCLLSTFHRVKQQRSLPFRYASYKATCGNSTMPGEPCCWLKSAIGPAHLWSNDEYCSAAGVVFVPGPL